MKFRDAIKWNSRMRCTYFSGDELKRGGKDAESAIMTMSNDAFFFQNHQVWDLFQVGSYLMTLARRRLVNLMFHGGLWA